MGADAATDRRLKADDYISGMVGGYAVFNEVACFGVCGFSNQWIDQPAGEAGKGPGYSSAHSLSLAVQPISLLTAQRSRNSDFHLAGTIAGLHSVVERHEHCVDLVVRPLRFTDMQLAQPGAMTRQDDELRDVENDSEVTGVLIGSLYLHNNLPCVIQTRRAHLIDKQGKMPKTTLGVCRTTPTK